VSAGCTGTLQLNSENLVSRTFNIVVNAGNNMFQIIETISGTHSPGFALAQGTGPCGLSGKKQVMSMNLVGGTVSDGQITSSEDTVGQLTLNGKGSVVAPSAATFASNAGLSSNVPVTGTYTESVPTSGGCTGTLAITRSDTGATLNFTTVVVDGGKEWMLLETDGGTITAGFIQE
jgi:hypothetical protein